MEKIGKYEVKQVLGEGATSTVYLCFDPFAGHDVAVKLVNPKVLNDAQTGHLFKKLFISEASLAGKLTHPHIASIFDAVNDDDTKYIVMEYVPGGTLEKFTKPETLLPPDKVVEIIFKASRALDFAFRIGVTHRDIKPANILAVMDGNNVRDVKITDFGAAITGSKDQTQVSGVGSPAYMSPQQITDDVLDHQTDIYSLGVVMYQLLTGHLPFEADNNFSMIYQIVNVEPTPPTTFRPNLPPEVERVVMKAIRKSTAERYPRWEEFSLDLAELVRNRDIFSVDPSEIADAERFNLLRAMQFFAGFSDVEIWEVVRLGLWERLVAGHTIFQEGSAGDYFYVIAEGQAKVTKRGKLLNVIQAGECVGEMAYLAYDAPRPRSADVVTISACTTVGLTPAGIAQASEACQHHFDRAFLRILVDRLTLANQRLSNS